MADEEFVNIQSVTKATHMIPDMVPCNDAKRLAITTKQLYDKIKVIYDNSPTPVKEGGGMASRMKQQSDGIDAEYKYLIGCTDGGNLSSAQIKKYLIENFILLNQLTDGNERLVGYRIQVFKDIGNGLAEMYRKGKQAVQEVGSTLKFIAWVLGIGGALWVTDRIVSNVRHIKKGD